MILETDEGTHWRSGPICVVASGLLMLLLFVFIPWALPLATQEWKKRVPCNPELASLCAARGGARIPLGVPRSVGRTVLQHSSASLGEARTQRRSYVQDMEAT